MQPRFLFALSSALTLTSTASPVPLGAQTHRHVAIGIVRDHVAGGATHGAMANWNAIDLGRGLGVNFSLGVRGFATWGSEPDTEAGRRARYGLSPTVYLNLSDTDAATRVQLFAGVGFAHQRVSGVTEAENAPRPVNANRAQTDVSSHSGVGVIHSIGKRWSLYGEVALNREGADGGKAAFQVAIGVALR